jgi:hypothetical protein
LRDFFAGVPDRGVEAEVAGVDVPESTVDLLSAVAMTASVVVGEVLRRAEGGSSERVAPDVRFNSATVDAGDSGFESMSRRAFESTVVSALRKLRRFATVCVGRMLSLIAVGGLLASTVWPCGASPAGDSLLPSEITTLMAMLLGESSLLDVCEETELLREGMMAR